MEDELKQADGRVVAPLSSIESAAAAPNDSELDTEMRAGRIQMAKWRNVFRALAE